MCGAEAVPYPPESVTINLAIEVLVEVPAVAALFW
jgi:hypothetical protein